MKYVVSVMEHGWDSAERTATLRTVVKKSFDSEEVKPILALLQCTPEQAEEPGLVSLPVDPTKRTTKDLCRVALAYILGSSETATVRVDSRLLRRVVWQKFGIRISTNKAGVALREEAQKRGFKRERTNHWGCTVWVASNPRYIPLPQPCEVKPTEGGE